MKTDILEAAWAEWNFRHYDFRTTDQEMEEYMKLTVRGPWLKKVREASLLSMRQVAARMKVSPSEYCRWERTESSGRVTLEKLQQCAEAMGCELVYAIRPKRRLSFSRTLWATLLANIKLPSVHLPRRSTCIATLARNKMYDPQFRKEQGWALNSLRSAGVPAKLCKIRRALQRNPNSIFG
jgi:transcriptional regulator with XRE-family HTH domain